jgi:ATP-dependent protease ClpP protease subunit
MQKAEAHVYFSDTIGLGDWFYGTVLQDVRYIVEGQGFLFGEPAPDNALPQTVFLHFPACQGGDVVEGYAIYNYVRGLAAKGVKTVARIEGLCASIAVLCAIACDTVEMADAALLMVHKPSTDGWNLTADDAQAAADLLNKIQAQLVSRYVARTGMSAETANELINKTSWLTADECISYGFVSSKIPDAPIVAPVGTEGVLNYYPKSKPAPTMAISAAEKQGIVNDVLTGIKNFFGGTPPKNEAIPAEPVAPAVVNASAEVTDNDTMYFEGDTLAVDTPVYSDAELTVAYADGDYSLADGRDVTVAAGIVTSLTDAAADDSAAGNVPPENNAAPAASTAELEAATARIAELENQLNVANRKVTGLSNKLAKVVPGSAGNPTPPGAAQNMLAKTGSPKNTGGLMVSLTQPSSSNRK